jgi:hypothetical protein
MPVILRIGSFRFFFYSNEGDPREPVHVPSAEAAPSPSSGSILR